MRAVGAELMLLGFISLLLTVFQGTAQKICVRESIMHHMLPCPLPPPLSAGAKYSGAGVFTGGVLGGARRLLAGGGAANDYCQKKVLFDLVICRPELFHATGTYGTRICMRPASFQYDIEISSENIIEHVG